jgi:hypothetical protein
VSSKKYLENLSFKNEEEILKHFQILKKDKERSFHHLACTERNTKGRLDSEAHAYNPRYSGARNREDICFRLSQEKSW